MKDHYLAVTRKLNVKLDSVTVLASKLKCRKRVFGDPISMETAMSVVAKQSFILRNITINDTKRPVIAPIIITGAANIAPISVVYVEAFKSALFLKGLSVSVLNEEHGYE